MTDPALSVRILWLDDTMVEICARACAPHFSAEVSFYESRTFAHDFAEALRGFPQDPLDTRRHGLGNWATLTSGAGVEFRFSCDSVGRIQIVAHFETAEILPEEIPPKVAFLLHAEAAGIDRFCAQLRSMPIEVGASADLAAA